MYTTPSSFRFFCCSVSHRLLMCISAFCYGRASARPPPPTPSQAVVSCKEKKQKKKKLKNIKI
ncbi:hypothetical protein LY76DRAFT_595719 [Colletotrichum caudatum]|nr:hypothetical protein LY76DRAFT_595719 [Colletotrichum caudatum]